MLAVIGLRVVHQRTNCGESVDSARVRLIWESVVAEQSGMGKCAARGLVYRPSGDRDDDQYCHGKPGNNKSQAAEIYQFWHDDESYNLGYWRD